MKRGARALTIVLIVAGVAATIAVSVLQERLRPAAERSNGESAPVSEQEHETIGGLRVLGVVYTRSATNVRASASGSARIVRKTAPGERLRFIDASGDWFRVVGSDTAATEWVHQSKVITEFEYRQRATAHLAVGAWSWREEYSYAIAEGQVTNVSDGPLRHVTAVVSFHAADGTFITSDDALIEYDPLLPGQTSPWKVMTRWNPRMGNANLEFATLGGGTLRSYRE